MKNGFTKTQNSFITAMTRNLKEGDTLEASAVLLAFRYGTTVEYILDTFESFRKMVVATS